MGREKTNEALLAKLEWCVTVNSDKNILGKGYQSKIFKRKKKKKKKFFKLAPKPKSSSWLWKGICGSIVIIQKGLCYQVGSSESINMRPLGTSFAEFCSTTLARKA